MANRWPYLLPNLTLSHWISPNLIESHPISLNLIKSCQISPYLTKYHHIILNLTEPHQMYRISLNLAKSHYVDHTESCSFVIAHILWDISPNFAIHVHCIRQMYPILPYLTICHWIVLNLTISHRFLPILTISHWISPYMYLTKSH